MHVRIKTYLLSAIVLCGAITAASFAWQNAQGHNKPGTKADDNPRDAHGQGGPGQGQGFPDLIGALKEAPGCLGVEVGQMMSGKRVIFSWFKDKQSVVDWYYSEPHQKVLDTFFAEHPQDFHPLESVPDGAGPLLVIASITMSDKPEHKETSLPVSQIAIEIYKPVPGGLFLGSRFAPDSVHVDHMQDYTPKSDDAKPEDQPTNHAPATVSQD